MTDKNADLLKSEYLHIQNVIEGFDNKFLLIKGWSVSFSFAIIGAAYASGYWILLLISILSSALFWHIEALWKAFQYSYYKRIFEIEKYFSGENQSLLPFQISSSWFESWHSDNRKKVILFMLWRNVLFPHFGVLCFSAVLLYLHFSGIIPIIPK